MDIYTWQAVYYDETVTPEFDESRPDGRGFLEVEKPVKMLQLSNPKIWHRVAIPEDANPVFFRRRTIEIDPNSDGSKHTTVHCIGWKRDDEASYLFVFEDGSTLLTSDFRAV